jgi:hypothetical protein
MGRFVVDLGPVRSLIDVSPAEVAWRPIDGCNSDAECPLHITDIVTGKDRVVAPLPGHGGFIGGGAFSPDGRLLAAFVSAGPDIGRTAGVATGQEAQLVVIDEAGASAAPSNSVVPISEPVAAAVWSSGHVFFGGTAGVIHTYGLGATQAITLKIPTSYAFTIYPS